MSEPGRLQAELLRTAPPGPLPTDSEPGLIEQIRAEIGATGPLTFARFMELALYHPEHGYYRSAIERPGRSGDFLTAPETHPIFGAAVARRLAAIWTELDRPDPFVVREYGAGSGTLAASILAGLRADESELIDALVYDPIEINAHRREGIADRLGPVGARIPPGTGRITGVVLANEFLDALPVHRVEQRDGRLLECYVDWDAAAGKLVERALEPSSPALAERLERDGVALAGGQVGEICLGLEPWLAGLAADLERGLVIVFDYGHRAPALYDPGRAGGSLRAYAGHRAHADPFIAIGHQDLTAHVDLTALEAIAGDCGFDLSTDQAQAEFLIAAGLPELVDRIRSNPATTMEEWLALRSAIGRLLDPAALGGFRVVQLRRLTTR